MCIRDSIYTMTIGKIREIAAGVPGVILEVGFLNLDREILTTQPDLVAGAITEGILCYVDEVLSLIHI